MLPSIFWAYYISSTGFVLAVIIGGLILVFEPGVLSIVLKGKQNISMIRVNSSGGWLLLSTGNIAQEGQLEGGVRIGPLMILRFKAIRVDNFRMGLCELIKGSHFILMIRDQTSSGYAFHRLNMYLSQ